MKGKIGRTDRLIKEKQNDVYLDRQKYSERTLCTKCGALYQAGRWTWEQTEDPLNRALCPACKRITDGYPAGTIELYGAFFRQHQDELMNLIANVERKEKNLHALERIIKSIHKADRTIVTTTGIHLARRIGEALLSAYKGELTFQYLDADKGIRVSWQR